MMVELLLGSYLNELDRRVARGARIRAAFEARRAARTHATALGMVPDAPRMLSRRLLDRLPAPAGKRAA